MRPGLTPLLRVNGCRQIKAGEFECRFLKGEIRIMSERTPSVEVEHIEKVQQVEHGGFPGVKATRERSMQRGNDRSL